MQGKKFCFTLHAADLSSESEAALADVFYGLDWGVYGGGQLERAPDTGRLHIQGFVVFPKNMRLAALKKLSATAHWELMRGTVEESEAYCSKEESRAAGYAPRTWGVRPVSNQGARTDIDDAVACATALIAAGKTTAQVMTVLAVEHASFFLRKGNNLGLWLSSLPRPVAPLVLDLRPWQSALAAKLEGPVHSRQIYWVYDPSGAAGKSTFISWYVRQAAGTAVALSGKVNDMAYVYDAQRVVFFDISRAGAEHSDHLYTFAEQLKNGQFMSGKYQPVVKMFDPPHVVFFSNSEPNYTKWSKDRYVVYAFPESCDCSTYIPDGLASGSGSDLAASAPDPTVQSAVGFLAASMPSPFAHIDFDVLSQDLMRDF